LGGFAGRIWQGVSNFAWDTEPTKRQARLDWMKCIPENCQFTIARGAQAGVLIPLYWSARGLLCTEN
jgi:hypothetical protein